MRTPTRVREGGKGAGFPKPAKGLAFQTKARADAGLRPRGRGSASARAGLPKEGLPCLGGSHQGMACVPIKGGGVLALHPLQIAWHGHSFLTLACLAIGW
jgi:hypothetical protein